MSVECKRGETVVAMTTRGIHPLSSVVSSREAKAMNIAARGEIKKRRGFPVREWIGSENEASLRCCSLSSLEVVGIPGLA